MESMVKTRQWGNSVGVILPNRLVKQSGIKLGEELMITVEKKRNVLRELFGALKFRKSADALLKEFRSELESKWFR